MKSATTFRPHWIVILSGAVPVVAVHLAWWINGPTLVPGDCSPYLTGCLSVSGASRGGEGLHLFRALMLPTTTLLALSWLLLGRWLTWLDGSLRRGARWMAWLGFTGALFLVLYATWLGTDGDLYRWLRRQGVIFFFGLTGLAQLLLFAMTWPRRHQLAAGRLQPWLRALWWSVVLEWLIGIASAGKDLYISDANAADALGNILEWYFLWTLCLIMVIAGGAMRRSGFALGPAGAAGRGFRQRD